MKPPKFSIVIPARNEERFIGACLESIRAAAVAFGDEVEIIVVLNRCTDRTEEIARSSGARTTRQDARNLSKIRNAGARAATGDYLLTIDADSTMSEGTLAAVERALSSGNTVGGGVSIYPDRSSPGIWTTVFVFNLYAKITNLSCGMFWCRRVDFHAVGGFDERLLSAEDIDLAKRLKAYGKKIGRPFSTLRGGHIVTSCRKFDAFGDWCVFRNPRLVWRLVRGKSQVAADEFYYNFKR